MKRREGNKYFKPLGIFLMLLAGGLGLIGCGVQTDYELARVTEEFQKDTDFTIVGPLEEMVQSMLSPGGAYGPVVRYSLAAQFLISYGNYAKTIELMKEAVAIDAKIADPHFILAETYYRLAMFDMAKRGLMEINTLAYLPTPNRLLDYCYLEILELVLPNRPKTYSQLLYRSGFSEIDKEHIANIILNLKETEISSSNGNGALKLMIAAPGTEILPLPVWHPDKKSKRFLARAKNEIELGLEGELIAPLPIDDDLAIHISDLETVYSLYHRINSLLE